MSSGLSSLERVELLMVLENELDATVDERAVSEAATVADLEALVAAPAAASRTPEPSFRFPSWSQSRLVRGIRWMCLRLWLLPLTRLFAWIRVDGLEHLTAVRGPVVFAANHQSFMDTPVILAALPPAVRYRVVTAMAKEFFAPHFHPERHTRRARLTNRLNYYLATALFNAFPLPQREAGTRHALRYAGELIGGGNSLLIYPEGRRTVGDAIARFQPGAAMIAARLGVPVLPVRLRGIDLVLGQGRRMAAARPGRRPVRPAPASPRDGLRHDGGPAGSRGQKRCSGPIVPRPALFRNALRAFTSARGTRGCMCRRLPRCAAHLAQPWPERRPDVAPDGLPAFRQQPVPWGLEDPGPIGL